MSNLTELKNILTALGGTPAAGDTNDETLAKIYAAIDDNSGLGDKLPTVTASNAGQVLTVSAEGKWVAADLPSPDSSEHAAE